MRSDSRRHAWEHIKGFRAGQLKDYFVSVGRRISVGIIFFEPGTKNLLWVGIKTHFRLILAIFIHIRQHVFGDLNGHIHHGVFLQRKDWLLGSDTFVVFYITLRNLTGKGRV